MKVKRMLSCEEDLVKEMKDIMGRKGSWIRWRVSDGGGIVSFFDLTLTRFTLTIDEE